MVWIISITQLCRCIIAKAHARIHRFLLTKFRAYRQILLLFINNVVCNRRAKMHNNINTIEAHLGWWSVSQSSYLECAKIMKYPHDQTITRSLVASRIAMRRLSLCATAKQEHIDDLFPRVALSMESTSECGSKWWNIAQILSSGRGLWIYRQRGRKNNYCENHQLNELVARWRYGIFLVEST